jgi:RsiW-degrading membrane proteinase PrsW (M82 family)
MVILPSMAVGVLPALLFLAGLRLLDSFKLVRGRDVVSSIVAGAACAGLAYFPNVWLLDHAHIDPSLLRRYIAPVIEETLKGTVVLWMVRREKVGFMVDAGIHGFAVGTGFAVVENVYYAAALGRFDPGVWIVRGLGTAVLHGSTTAVVGILAMDLTERLGSRDLRHFVPGLLLAIAVHSLYNHLLLNPLLTTAMLLVGMPLFVVAVFERSERATRDWLGTGLDGDVERLEQILEGEVEHTPVGEYLESLRHRFAGAVLADMLCLLRTHLELSLRAKGMLIARAAGVDLPPDPGVRASLDELRYLERAIGPTGRLAIQPLLRTSSRDLWQVHVLGATHRS